MARALFHIQENYPESRQNCLAEIVSSLENYKNNDDTLNAFLVGHIVDMRATEHLDLIRKAYKEGYVDIDVEGDIEDVEIRIGVREKRSTPRPHYQAGLRALFERLFQNEKEADIDNFFDDKELPHINVFKDIGRNDPCYCGSGKKYKKCCLS